MPSTWDINVTGEEQLTAKLTKLQNVAANLDAPMEDALKLLRNDASVLPPQPARDRAPSGRFNTWEREVGELPLAAFKTTTGKLRKRASRGMGVLRPSEKMMLQWKEAPMWLRKTIGAAVGYIENKASYAPSVQGDKQASYHALTGWRTVAQIAEQNASKVGRIFSDFINELIQE
ncbi:MAG: hypothetical protein WCF84_19060 [Anaerolineae bacterium]